ncbi:HAD family hydrolase [Streptomyces xanthochromogenes]|uniref:HAD family hydrolase n=1 Tax=Streptomyces xanthochromogenes TaxID=67384 RepID=UPI0037FEDC96
MRFVLFDLDNTLIDRQGTLAVWAEVFCRERDLDERAARYLVDALSERAYPHTFEWLRHELALEESTAQLWAAYVDGIAHHVTVNPGAIDGLGQLRAEDWKLGILTNGAADIQRAKITAAGLTNAVDAIVISEEIGVRKPDTHAFHTAVAQIGGSPSAPAWMVGDNPAGDIAGAHQAGLRTIWLRGRPWPADVDTPYYSVDTIAEAITLLLTEGSR